LTKIKINIWKYDWQKAFAFTVMLVSCGIIFAANNINEKLLPNIIRPYLYIFIILYLILIMTLALHTIQKSFNHRANNILKRRGIDKI